LFLGLHVIGVFGNTIHRANLDTLGSIVMTHALGAEVRVNYIDLIALGDRSSEP
jgi:hypothetical protein